MAAELIDTHAHLHYSAFELYPETKWEYLANLVYGVTTTYDPSAPTIDVFAQAEMVEAQVRRLRRRADAVLRRNLRDEDLLAAEVHVDARLAVLVGAENRRSEHLFIEERRRFRIGAPQVDVVELERAHASLVCASFLCLRSYMSGWARAKSARR